MTDTPKCGEGCTLPANHTGRCAPYGVCRCGSVFDGPARDNHNLGCPVSPDKGLDFDLRAALHIHEPLCEVGLCDTCDAYITISAQHLAALEGVRKEEREKWQKDAERWRWLVKTFEAAKGGAGLEVNRKLAYYETPEPGKEVDLHWYPDTPVGFYEVFGATMAEAVDEAMREEAV